MASCVGSRGAPARRARGCSPSLAAGQSPTEAASARPSLCSGGGGLCLRVSNTEASWWRGLGGQSLNWTERGFSSFRQHTDGRQWGHTTPRATARLRPAGLWAATCWQEGSSRPARVQLGAGAGAPRGKDRSRQPAPARGRRGPGAGDVSGLRAESLLIPSSEKKFSFFASMLQALYFFKKPR